ncbi:MAG: NHL repeat-containing protein [Acidobacteriota bacterium]
MHYSWGSLACLTVLLGAVPWASVSPAFAQKIEVVNGVKLVHNEKGGRWGRTPRVRLELIRKIGGLEEKNPALAFNNPYDVAVDSQGNIHVLDKGNNRIQKLGPDGRFLRSIGRPGQGPGDIQRALSMDIDPQDFLYVSESGNMRLQVFDASGKSLRLIKFKTPLSYRIRRLPSGLIVRGGMFNLWELRAHPGKLPPLLELLDSDGKVRKAFGQATNYKDALVNTDANTFHFDVDRQGNVLVSFWHQNRIDKYSPDGELLWRADRPLNYGTEVMDKGGIKHMFDGGAAILSPRMNDVSMGIAADAKGRIWVNTYNRQPAREEMGESVSVGNARRVTREAKIIKMDIYKLEVFDPDGVLLGEIPLAHLASGLRIAGDLLFIWEDADDAIYEYRIIENEGGGPN